MDSSGSEHHQVQTFVSMWYLKRINTWTLAFKHMTVGTELFLMWWEMWTIRRPSPFAIPIFCLTGFHSNASIMHFKYNENQYYKCLQCIVSIRPFRFTFRWVLLLLLFSLIHFITTTNRQRLTAVKFIQFCLHCLHPHVATRCTNVILESGNWGKKCNKHIHSISIIQSCSFSISLHVPVALRVLSCVWFLFWQITLVAPYSMCVWRTNRERANSVRKASHCVNSQSHPED